MKKEKYTPKEKTLCQKQVAMIEAHCRICSICRKSKEEYDKCHEIPTTPPCYQFIQELDRHIQGCKECSLANQKWNEDSIPVSPEIRQVASDLGNGRMPKLSMLREAASQLIKSLDMSSDEVRQAREKAESLFKKRFKPE